MKILMISDVYFPRINGVSTSIRSFREGLQARGHRVRLIAPAYPEFDETDAEIIRVDSRYLFFDPEDRLMRRGEIRKCLADLRADPPDLIHIHTPFMAHYAGLELAKALGCPVVETYHTFFEEYLFHYAAFLPRGFLRGLARRFSRTQGNSVDALIVPSRAMYKALQAYGVSSRMEILPTGLDLSKFNGGDGAAFRAQHGIAPERPCLVYVGRVAFEKNIDFLLDVVAQVRRSQPNVLLIIAGEGPALANLKKQVRQRGLTEQILFIGYLRNPQDLWSCYQAGNAFVFASRTETQGLVLLEAMALGVPVVSTAVMGTKDILDAGEGALVAEDNVEAFAKRVVYLLERPDLQAELSKQGLAYVEEWRAERMAERVEVLYQSLIEAK